jgi:hypothetical protein
MLMQRVQQVKHLLMLNYHQLRVQRRKEKMLEVQVRGGHQLIYR